MEIGPASLQILVSARLYCIDFRAMVVSCSGNAAAGHDAVSKMKCFILLGCTE
jgi:hypothetical protein